MDALNRRRSYLHWNKFYLTHLDTSWHVIFLDLPCIDVCLLNLWLVTLWIVEALGKLPLSPNVYAMIADPDGRVREPVGAWRDLTVFARNVMKIIWKYSQIFTTFSKCLKRFEPLSRWRWWPLVQGIPFSTRTCRSRRFGQGPGHSNKTRRTSRYAKYIQV